MKIECSRQLCAEKTDRRTDRVTPCAPIGAKNIYQIRSMMMGNSDTFDFFGVWFIEGHLWTP